MNIAPFNDLFEDASLFQSTRLKTWVISLEPIAKMICRDLGYPNHINPRNDQPWDWCVEIILEFCRGAFQVWDQSLYINHVVELVDQEIKLIHLDTLSTVEKWQNEVVLYLGQYMGLRGLNNVFPYLYQVKPFEEDYAYDYLVSLYDVSKTEIKCYYSIS